MDELVYHHYSELHSENAVAIVGFPSLGLVSSIATSFLAKQLELDLVGAVSSSSFPPYTVIQNGVPVPPVRFYGGCRKTDEGCDGGIECDDLYIITSEFVPKTELMDSMAELIVEWCQRNNVRTVITLDGIPVFSPDTYSIIGVGSTEYARSMMNKYDIDTFDDGMVRGLSGLILMKAVDADLDVITLLGSARQDVPDPKGAAKLMEPLTRLLPELKVDTEPLYQEADDIDRRMQGQEMHQYRSQDIYG